MANPIGMSAEHMREIAKLPRQRTPVVIDPYASRQKLQEIGFDPLLEMQKQYDNITMMIDNANASTRPPSFKDLAPMIAIQERLAIALAKYGYSVIKEASGLDDNVAPKKIILSN